MEEKGHSRKARLPRSIEAVYIGIRIHAKVDALQGRLWSCPRLTERNSIHAAEERK